MTALKEYDRLECSGLWKAGPDNQRRDVVLSFGDATLVIADGAGRPLAHWSLPAIERVNPGLVPAIFAPDPEASETLEIDDELMIKALEKVHRSVQMSRPKEGRLRQIGTLSVLAVTLALGVFWLPGALRDQALKVVPQVKRTEIGATLLGHLQRLTGPTCRTPLGSQALGALHDRLFGGQSEGQIVVASSGINGAVALPGDIIVIGRNLVEGYEDPAVVAGFVLAAAEQSKDSDPLGAVLKNAGFMATLKLLATGDVPPEQLQASAKSLVDRPGARPSDDSLLAAFAAANLPSGPYAYALDPTGEATLGLIEADPIAATGFPLILGDSDWVSLQGICSG